MKEDGAPNEGYAVDVADEHHRGPFTGRAVPTRSRPLLRCGAASLQSTRHSESSSSSSSITHSEPQHHAGEQSVLGVAARLLLGVLHPLLASLGEAWGRGAPESSEPGDGEPGAPGDGKPLEMPPPEYCCPISTALMRDPVVTQAGQTYERSTISRWLEGHDTDPITNTRLASKQLIPVVVLRNLIAEWSEAHSDALEDMERRATERHAAVRIQAVWRSRLTQRRWFEAAVAGAKRAIAAELSEAKELPPELRSACSFALAQTYSDLSGRCVLSRQPSHCPRPCRVEVRFTHACVIELRELHSRLCSTGDK